MIINFPFAFLLPVSFHSHLAAILWCGLALRWRPFTPALSSLSTRAQIRPSMAQQTGVRPRSSTHQAPLFPSAAPRESALGSAPATRL